MNHDDDIDAQRAAEGTPARGRHSDDHTSQVADHPSEDDDLGGGDDSLGDANSQVDQQQIEEVAEVDEILDGEFADDPQLRGQITETSWRAPLPPPHALEHYERILPGAADRVLRMAERQLDIREARESTVHMAMQGEVNVQKTLAEGDRDALKRGQYLAAGISALVAALSFAGMFLTPWAAIGFAVPLAQVAGALVRTISDGHTQAEPSIDSEKPSPASGDS